MTRDFNLDPNHPSLTAIERSIVVARNDHPEDPRESWASIAKRTGKTKTTLRGAWDNACRKVYGAPSPLAAPRFEDATIGNEQTMRGIPVTGRGVGGAMKGTKPEQYADFIPNPNIPRRNRRGRPV